MATPRQAESSLSMAKPRSINLSTRSRHSMTPRNMKSDLLFRKPASKFQGKANTETGFKSRTTVAIPEGYRDRAKERNEANSEETSNSTIALDLELLRRTKAGEITTVEPIISEPRVIEEDLEKAFVAPPKLSRNEILGRLKDRQPKLGCGDGHKSVDSSRFRPIEAQVDVNEPRIVTGKDGKTKRKVKRIKMQDDKKIPNNTPPEKPLDIFDDVGADYDPFAGMDNSDKDEDVVLVTIQPSHQQKRSYFRNSSTADDAQYEMNVPDKEELLAAVRKASKLQILQDQLDDEDSPKKKKEIFSGDAYDGDYDTFGLNSNAVDAEDDEDGNRKKRRRKRDSLSES